MPAANEDGEIDGQIGFDHRRPGRGAGTRACGTNIGDRVGSGAAIGVGTGTATDSDDVNLGKPLWDRQP